MYIVSYAILPVRSKASSFFSEKGKIPFVAGVDDCLHDFESAPYLNVMYLGNVNAAPFAIFVRKGDLT